MLAGCGEVAKLPIAAGTGPQPTLPPPVHTVVPTVRVAPAKGWPAGAVPQPATLHPTVAAQRSCL